MVSLFDSKMIIRGNCGSTCHTPNYYIYSTENTNSEVVTQGEIEDLLIYKPDTQKMAKYEVTAKTITDVLDKLEHPKTPMLQTFYAIEDSEP